MPSTKDLSQDVPRTRASWWWGLGGAGVGRGGTRGHGYASEASRRLGGGVSSAPGGGGGFTSMRLPGPPEVTCVVARAVSQGGDEV